VSPRIECAYCGGFGYRGECDQEPCEPCGATGMVDAPNTEMAYRVALAYHGWVDHPARFDMDTALPRLLRDLMALADEYGVDWPTREPTL